MQKVTGSLGNHASDLELYLAACYFFMSIKKKFTLTPMKSFKILN